MFGRCSGIIYFSKLPPFMKPAKLRHLMGQYGTIGKLFMKPEDDAMTAKRKKFGGNKKKKFTEGWVEFDDKKIARSVVRPSHHPSLPLHPSLSTPSIRCACA